MALSSVTIVCTLVSGDASEGQSPNIEMSSCTMDELVVLPSITIVCTLVSRGRPQWAAIKRAF